MHIFSPLNSKFQRAEQVKKNIACWEIVYATKYSKISFNGMNDLLADNYRWYGTVGADFGLQLASERDYLATAAQTLKSAFPDLHFTHHMFGEGQLLGNFLVIEGTHLGDYFGIKPTGNKVRFIGTAIARFDQTGRLVEERELWDEGELLKQIDVIPDKDATVLIDIFESYLGRPLTKRYPPARIRDYKELLYQPETIEPDKRDPQVIRNANNWRQLTARKYYTKEFDRLDELLSPQYQWQGALGLTFSMVGDGQPEALIRSFENTSRTIPDIHYTSQTFGEGDMVVYNIVGNGTAQAPIEGVEAAIGKPMRHVNISIGRFDQQGRLTEETEIIDNLALYKQFGVIPDDKNHLTLLDVLRQLEKVG